MKPVVLNRRLPHPVERVWRAIANEQELAAWFPGPPGHGTVTEWDEPRVIAFGDGTHHVRFELVPDGDGTALTFTHTFPSGGHDDFAAGWEIYLAILDAHLSGVPLGEQAAHDERRFALGEGPALRLERGFLVGVDRLWRALTETDELTHWFPEAMEVVESDPPRLLVARWHGSTLRFELEPDGDFSRLTFVHAFDDRDQAALTAAGWDRCFARLEALLSGAPMGEKASLELWPHVHEGYAETFGVDPEIGRRAYSERPAS